MSVADMKLADEQAVDLVHPEVWTVAIASAPDDLFYIEWIDSFWAKEVQELFNIDRKAEPIGTMARLPACLRWI